MLLMSFSLSILAADANGGYEDFCFSADDEDVGKPVEENVPEKGVEEGWMGLLADDDGCDEEEEEEKSEL